MSETDWRNAMALAEREVSSTGLPKDLEQLQTNDRFVTPALQVNEPLPYSLPESDCRPYQRDGACASVRVLDFRHGSRSEAK
jgi:hypothetical protein